MKTTSTILVSLVKVTTPSGKVNFTRWKAAIPNTAARDFHGEPKPSFRAPYLVDESSDMPVEQMDERITRDFFAALESQGYRIAVV